MPDGSVPPREARGRGALSNPANRFEAAAGEAFDDGWGTWLEELPPLRTELIREAARSALTYNDSPDLGFDRSLNPYRGCEHGCVYCFARPSHAYLGFSPGLDFEAKLLFKPDLPAILAKELARPGYVPRTVTLGANTDPYQPVERTLGLTRQVLEVLERFGHPVSIVTKGAGVLRDLDILGRMAARNLVRVYVSVTTLDARLARAMEPRAATPARRLHAIAALAQAGVPVAVLAAPMIPALNDAELERILDAAKRHGASSAGYVLLRLPHELRDLVTEWLHRHYPERAGRVLALVRETRGGALYDARFGQRQTGSGHWAGLLAQRFAIACRRLGLPAREEHAPLSTAQFDGRAMDPQPLLL